MACELDFKAMKFFPAEPAGGTPPEGWMTIDSLAERQAPLWRSNPDDIYWYHYLEDEGVVYFKYQQVHEKEDVLFQNFVHELSGVIEDKDANALIIDVRQNTGGDSSLYLPLPKMLIALEDKRDVGLFVLISPATYSAAMNFVADLEYFTNAVFVGEPTGASINFIGENRIFTMPNSGLMCSVSDRYHQHGASDSTDRRSWLAPHIVAPISSTDLLSGRDPGLESILAEVRARKDKQTMNRRISPVPTEN